MIIFKMTLESAFDKKVILQIKITFSRSWTYFWLSMRLLLTNVPLALPRSSTYGVTRRPNKKKSYIFLLRIYFVDILKRYSLDYINCI